MSTLHLIFNSIGEQDQLSRCIELAQHEDEILFLENGIYCVQHPLGQQLLSKSGIKSYLLEADASSRGMQNQNDYPMVNHETFVQLTVKHDKTISWY